MVIVIISGILLHSSCIYWEVDNTFGSEYVHCLPTEDVLGVGTLTGEGVVDGEDVGEEFTAVAVVLWTGDELAILSDGSRVKLPTGVRITLFIILEPSKKRESS